MLVDVQLYKLEPMMNVLVYNALVALIYLIIKLIRKDINRGLMMSIFIIICPLVGPLYLFLSWSIYYIYFRKRQKDVSLEELSLSKEKITVISKPEMNHALNKVPLEEALLISDQKNVRKVLLDMLKEDINASVGVIFKALEHNDSEVSHYAASAISDTINEFKKKEKQYRQKYSNEKENSTLCREYVEFLYDFLSHKILSYEEQKYYCNLFEELVITIKTYLPSEATGHLYYKLVCILTDLEENDKARFWVYHALYNNENDLGSYKAGLRYYYIKKDRRNFLLLMDKLKRSDVILDHETLEMVRFYSH